MSPEAQRIAIAKACGKRMDRPATGWHDLGCDCRECYPLPDYLNDLNAMHEAESAKDFHHNQRWIECLVDVGLRATALTLEKTNGWDWALVCARSTASQRAEAFLRTLNLWDQ
jgi:hypothetical protein